MLIILYLLEAFFVVFSHSCFRTSIPSKKSPSAPGRSAKSKDKHEKVEPLSAVDGNTQRTCKYSGGGSSTTKSASERAQGAFLRASLLSGGFYLRRARGLTRRHWRSPAWQLPRPRGTLPSSTGNCGRVTWSGQTPSGASTVNSALRICKPLYTHIFCVRRHQR